MKKKTKQLLTSIALGAIYIWILALYLPYYPAYSWIIDGNQWGRIQVSLSLLIFVFLLTLAVAFGIRKLKKKDWSLGAMSFWSALVGVLILNLGMASLPFVIGWDASTHYFITVREIAENWHFRSGIHPYLIELVLGIIGAIIGLKFVPMIMVVIGAILLVWGLWRWTTLLQLPPALQRITILTFFLIPTFQFQMTKDTKLDIILTGVILLALSFWYEKKHIKAAILLGLAPLMKLTAFWFWPGYVLYLLHVTWSVRKGKRKFPAQLKKTIVSILVLLFPLVAWGSWNIIRSEQPVTTKNFFRILIKSSGTGVKIVPLHKKVPELQSSLEEVQFLTLQSEPAQLSLAFAATTTLPKPVQTEVTEDTTPPRERPRVTARSEELERYGGWSLNPFSRIYSVLTSKNILVVMRHHTDMGFYWPWLVLGGILAFFLGARKRKQSLETFWIYGVLMVIFILWLYQGEGVPWYGIPMLMGLLPLCILWMEKYLLNPKIMTFFFIPPLVMGCIAWVYHYQPDYTLLSNQYWKNPTPENFYEVQQKFYRHEMIIGDIVNAPEHQTEKVWKIGSMVNAFIDQYDERVIHDPLIDRWAQFSYNKDDQKILDILAHNNIQWFVVDRYVPNIEMNPFGTLHQKYDGLMEFLNEHGDIHHDIRRLRLYRIKGG